MKKILSILAIAAIFSGCQKDSGGDVKIGPADLTSINNQLKGAWLYPVESQQVEVSGSAAPGGALYVAAPALQFDGSSHVNIMQDIKTTLKGTYTLSTKNDFIYLDITYPNGNDVLYQVLMADSETLELVSTVPYTPGGQAAEEASAATVSNVTLKKQTGADVSGHLIRVVVKSDTSTYSVAISVTHTRLKAPADSTILLNTKLNTTGTYIYEFAAKSGDQLYVDVLGDYTKTTFYAFYDGVPMAGNVGYDFDELKTTTGWLVP